MEREHIVATVLAAAEGRLVGRVRLQKTVYLLEQLGLESGFSFEYHHYGPYSRELDGATADAKAFQLIDEEIAYRHDDGAAYSVFKLKGAPKTLALGTLAEGRARDLVRQFADTNVTVLELAATAHWLWRHEGRTDWRAEITKRKGMKVRDGRLERAIALLRQLELAPPEPAAA